MPEFGIWSEPAPKGLTSRLAGHVQLWNEARRSARHEDSIFIWIPKNAGTSVYTMLRKEDLVGFANPPAARFYFRNAGRVTFGHMNIGALVDQGIVKQGFVDRAFKFALVRDPYTRAASLYRYHLKRGLVQNWHRSPTFGQFLQLLADGLYDRIGPYKVSGLSLCNPQVEWLRDAWPDKIYKTEDLGTFISDISARWQIPPPQIVHANSSTDLGDLNLSSSEKALIEQIYAEDFERFGYAKR